MILKKFLIIFYFSFTFSASAEEIKDNNQHYNLFYQVCLILVMMEKNLH